MIKKLLPFLFILLLVIPIGLFFYFFKDKTIADNRIDAIEAVPVDAILVFESKAAPNLLQLFNSKHQICEDLKYQDGFKPLIESLAELDSLLIRNKVLADKMNLMPGILSIHQTGEDKFQALFVLQSNGRIGYKDFMTLGSELAGNKGSHQEKTYTRTKIHQLKFSDGTVFPELFIASVKKYIVISPSDLLVEDVIRQVKT